MNNTLDATGSITDVAGRTATAVADAASEYAEPIVDTVSSSLSRRLTRGNGLLKGSGPSSGRVWFAGLVALALVGAVVAFARRNKSDADSNNSKPPIPGTSSDKADVGDVMGAQRRPAVNTTV